MDKTNHELTVYVFDKDNEQRVNTVKCLQYLWAGSLLAFYELETLQVDLVNSSEEDVFVASLSSFEHVDMASWLLGVGFKGHLVLLLEQHQDLPEFIPTNKVKALTLPVKLNDFESLFTEFKKNKDKPPVNAELVSSMLSRRDAISLEFQPQSYTSNEKLWGMECLVRFQLHGVPYDTKSVIKAIEDENRVGEFSDTLFRRLGEIAPAFGSTFLSINLSLIDIEKYELIKIVNQYLSDLNIKLNLVFEFSSDAFYKSHPLSINLLSDLKEQGYLLAMDTNGDELESLLKLPMVIDMVKINARHLTPANETLLHEVLHKAAQSDNILVVFTNIETYQQVSMAQRIAPGSIMQGYYLAPPIKIQEVFEILRNKAN